jgi:subtilisin family serine protease
MLLVRPAIVALTVAAVAGWAGPAQASRMETVRDAEWFLDAMHAPQAQSISKGGGVIVGLVDSGVDAGHPDLAGAVLPGMSFDSPSQNGLTDPNGHGTRMAGIIAARGGGVNNALGIAPAASILSIAVNPSNPSQLAAPIQYAVDHGARVINLSIGLANPTAPPDVAAAIENAVAHNVVVVAAIGNRSDLSAPSPYPGLPGVIGVAGTTRTGSPYANGWSGPHVAVAAPADQIVTTAPRDKIASGYGTNGGTSEATAMVTGVVALIRAKFPQLDAANVVNRVIRSAVDAGPPGRDDTYGYGIVDAQRALTMDIPSVANNPLGDPAAGPAATSAGGAVPGDNGGLPGGLTPDNGSSGTRTLLLLVCGGIVLLVVAALIGLVIWLSTRRKRPPPPPPPYIGVGPPPPPMPPANPYQYPYQQPPPPGPRGPAR